MFAAVEGHIEVVELLLRHGATHDREHKGWTALKSAAARGHVDVVELLLRHGARQDADNK